LIPAYGRALLEQATRDPRIIALDADLMVDMGLLPFAQELPERFLECGIAEMDMVSQAGGLALRGMLPVCHSFACFMIARANEHIFVNASERTKVVYTAGLAGLLPAAPGHSHQGLRDIALLQSIPGMTLIAPSDERDVELALDYALRHAEGSCYLRICSVPTALPRKLPERSGLQPGRGVIACAGTDATLIAYGPVMLRQAMLASEALAQRAVSLQVIALPWLNQLDVEWLLEQLRDQRWLFTLDDHFVQGGQGDMIWSALARAAANVRGERYGVEGLPACGQNDEVLRHHQLDAPSLSARILRLVSPRT
jgi:transketolase